MRDIFFSFVISCLSFTLISCGQTTEEGVASAVSSTSDAVNDTTGAVDNTLFGGTDSSLGSCDNQKVFVVGNIFIFLQPEISNISILFNIDKSLIQ